MLIYYDYYIVLTFLVVVILLCVKIVEYKVYNTMDVKYSKYWNEVIVLRGQSKYNDRYYYLYKIYLIQKLLVDSILDSSVFIDIRKSYFLFYDPRGHVV